jgi:hypothetical protein
MELRRGIETTEFWLSLTACLAGLILIMAGKTEAGTQIISFAIGGYSIARGAAKLKGDQP